MRHYISTQRYISQHNPQEHQSPAHASYGTTGGKSIKTVRNPMSAAIVASKSIFPAIFRVTTIYMFSDDNLISNPFKHTEEPKHCVL